MTVTVRTVVHTVIEGSVAAGATDAQTVGPDPVPTGKEIRVIRFGASEVGAGDGVASTIALQWGSGGTWETVRGVGLASVGFQCDVARTFTGDGAKKFRIVRINHSGAAKDVIAWVDGYQV